MAECFWCGTAFDGTYYRWLCPTCGAKASCCEGAPIGRREEYLCDVEGKPE